MMRDLKVHALVALLVVQGMREDPVGQAGNGTSEVVPSQQASSGPGIAVADAAHAAVDAAIWSPILGNGSNTLKVNSNAADVAAAGAAATMSPPVTDVKPEAAPIEKSQWYIIRLFQFVTGLTFPMIVKCLCVAGNLLVQVSPFPQVKRWEARCCTGESDSAPYVSIAFGGCQWCFYGVFAYLVTSRSGFLILLQSNFLGAILGTYYVKTFYRNCRNPESINTLQKYLSAVTALALLQVCALITLPLERALFLTGLVSSFCSFVGATAVLVTVPAVIRSKDSSSIPGPYAAANLASAVVWCLCGYMIEDPMVMMPNMFATICSAASLGLKVVYPVDFVPPRSNEDKLSLEMGMDEDILFEPTRTELRSVHSYLKPPSELTPMKPAAGLLKAESGDSGPFPNKFDYFKGAGQKLLAAPAAAWYGDGTGGTF